MFRSIDINKHCLIEASAGTGKTYTIERLVLRLVAEKKALLENILVVTFTEAAAGELRARVRDLLQDALDDALDDYRVDAGVKEHLRGQLFSFDKAAIYTIHGFCRRVLSRWPMEAGSGHGRAREIIDEKTLAETMVAEEMRATWETWDRELGGIVVQEIADVGQFRDMVCALALAYVPGVVELEPLPAKTPRELADRLAADKAIICGMVRRFLVSFNGIPRVTACSGKKFKDGNQDAAIAFVTSFPAGVPFTEATSLPGAPEAFGWMAGDRKKNPAINEAAGLWDSIVHGIKKYRAALPSLLKTSLAASLRVRMDEQRLRDGGTSFNDMIVAVERATAFPGAPLPGLLREQYRYAIIDEFQDTNALQWNIFRRVFMEGVGSTQRLFAVGDPKQSIFRVQNADVFTYLAARETFEKCKNESNGAAIKSLEINHRSSPGLVAACNAIFGRNDWFKIKGIPFVPAMPGTAGGPDIALWEKIFPKQPVVVRPTGALPAIGRRRQAFARYCAATIATWHCAGIPYNSMAILYQSRSAVKPLLALLRERGIPYSQYKENGLFDSDEAVNWTYLLDYLAIDSPENMKRLLLTDFFAQGPSDVISGIAYERFFPVLDQWLRLAQAGRWPQLLRAVFTDTALLERAKPRTEGKRVIAAYRQLGEWTAGRLIGRSMTPAAVALELRAFRSGARVPRDEEDRFRRETEGDAVCAMTLHASKGLQFDACFIFGGGKSPVVKKPYVIRSNAGVDRRDTVLVSLDERRKEEQRYEDECELQRLLYVGLTRARHKMVLPLWENADNCGASSLYDGNVLSAATALPDVFRIDETPLETLDADNGAKRLSYRPRVAAVGALPSPTYGEALGRITREAARFDLPSRRQVRHSYTSLVHEGRADSQPGDRELAPPKFVLSLDEGDYIAPDGAREAQGAIAVPGGRETGIALHAVLETIDFAAALHSTESFTAATHALIAQKLLENNVISALPSEQVRNKSVCDEAGRLVRAVLTMPLPMANGEAPLCIAAVPAADRLTEANFAASVDRASGAFGAAGGNDRVVGFVDLLFRRGNDVYLLDWKSDTLESYDKESLLLIMRERGYVVQAALYASAVDRWLTTRFPGAGCRVHGVFYVFLRGPAAIKIPVDDSKRALWEQALDKTFSDAARPKLMLSAQKE